MDTLSKKEHYGIFADILIETLAEYLPERWSSLMAMAWRDAVEHITAMMIEIGDHEQ